MNEPIRWLLRAFAENVLLSIYSALRLRPKRLSSTAPAYTVPPVLELVKVEIHHRRRVQRQHLADDQPTDDRNAERAAQFRSGPRPERQRQSAQQGGHGSHQ